MPDLTTSDTRGHIPAHSYQTQISLRKSRVSRTTFCPDLSVCPFHELVAVVGSRAVIADMRKVFLPIIKVALCCGSLFPVPTGESRNRLFLY